MFCLALSVFLTGKVFPLSVPEKPEGHVNDYAGILGGSAEARVEKALAVFERETTNQIVVVTFESLEGESLEDFSIRLAEKWKIGTKEKDNGVILLIFKKEREIRVEAGYGLEGALPDALAGQIIREEIVPAFREGDFDKGVLNGVNAIIQAAKGEYAAGGQRAYGRALGVFEKHKALFFLALVFYFLMPFIAYLLVLVIGWVLMGFPWGILVGLVAALFLEALRRSFLQSLVSETYSGRRRSGWSFGLPGGGSSSWGGSWGGGGFSGGGGSFGGGGASGRW
ncbi:MAG: TPM domain-containing protein [Candidatus Omnitrophica bacterium]|nr:TPM domain-containing protein [Candidatus Omnitrophota bacterium]